MFDDTNFDNSNYGAEATPESDPAGVAVAAVAAQMEALDAGPERVAEALDGLREAVATYDAAYASLSPFGLVTGRKRPGSLPGARAVAAVARKSRRRAAAK